MYENAEYKWQDPFAKRADMAARSNKKDQTDGSPGASWRKGGKSNSQGKGKQENT